MDAYVGMILAFAGDYAPDGWLSCDGSQLNIESYQALYGVLGFTYGGDGVKTFSLPDLRERVIIGAGQGPGLTVRNLGQTGGADNVVLTVDNLPVHSHSIAVSDQTGTMQTPADNCVLSSLDNPDMNFYDSFIDSTNPPTLQSLDSISISMVGGNAPHPNRQPYLELNYIICYNGNWPYNY